MIKKGTKIASPKGKLGVLIPGMGAVATTFIAGVEAIRTQGAKPFGSLTQMGTIRLGKRTDKRVPMIKDFVPLADVNDLVFGGWDIHGENCYETTLRSGVLERTLLDSLKPQLQSLKPWNAVFEKEVCQAAQRQNRQEGKDEIRPSPAGHRRHPKFQEVAELGSAGDDLVREHRDLSQARQSALVTGGV